MKTPCLSDSLSQPWLSLLLRRLTSLLLLTAFLAVGLTDLRADLVLHLDASVGSTVQTNGSNHITSWQDANGGSYDATPLVGGVIHEGRTFPTGLKGADFGSTKNTLQMLNSAEAASVMNFKGAAAGNSGFTLAFTMIPDVIPSQDKYTIGTKTGEGNTFSVQLRSNGQLRIVSSSNRSFVDPKLVADEAIAVIFSYEASTGVVTLWNSKSNTIFVHSLAENHNFTSGLDFELGTSGNSGSHFNGTIGELRHLR